jgi:hypothetical protein
VYAAAAEQGESGDEPTQETPAATEDDEVVDAEVVEDDEENK